MFLVNGCWAGYNTVHDNYSVNLYLDNAQNSTYEQNTVINLGTRAYYRGSDNGYPAQGVLLASEYYMRNTGGGQLSFPIYWCQVKNNTIKGCSRGFCFSSNFDGTVRGLNTSQVFGNTFEGSWWDAILVENGPHSNSTIRDNICRASGGTNSIIIAGSGVTDYNNSQV